MDNIKQFRFLNIVLIVFALLSTTALSDNEFREKLHNIRTSFYIAVENEDTTLSAISYIEEHFGTDTDEYPPVVLAFYADLTGLLGKHAVSPLTKYNHVNKAIGLINNAVEKDSTNLEIRFLRFSFFNTIPPLFKVGKQRDEDCCFVVNALHQTDYSDVPKNVQRDMMIYMLTGTKLKPDMRNRLSEIFKDVYGKE